MDVSVGVAVQVRVGVNEGVRVNVKVGVRVAVCVSVLVAVAVGVGVANHAVIEFPKEKINITTITMKMIIKLKNNFGFMA